MKIKIYCGHPSYGFIDHFTDEWNDGFYKNPREIDNELWEKYKKLREEFHEIHEQLWDLFESKESI